MEFGQADVRGGPLLAVSVSLDPHLTAVVRVMPPQSSSGAHPARRSDLGLLRDLQGIVDLDAEVPHRRFQLGVPEEQLDGTQVLGSTVDERRLRPAHRVRTVIGAV
jgi:hypothetical protein